MWPLLFIKMPIIPHYMLPSSLLQEFNQEGKQITWWLWEQKLQLMKIHFPVAKAIYYTHKAIIIKLVIPGFHYYY